MLSWFLWRQHLAVIHMHNAAQCNHKWHQLLSNHEPKLSSVVQEFHLPLKQKNMFFSPRLTINNPIISENKGGLSLGGCFDPQPVEAARQWYSSKLSHLWGGKKPTLLDALYKWFCPCSSEAERHSIIFLPTPETIVGGGEEQILLRCFMNECVCAGGRTSSSKWFRSSQRLTCSREEITFSPVYKATSTSVPSMNTLCFPCGFI